MQVCLTLQGKGLEFFGPLGQALLLRPHASCQVLRTHGAHAIAPIYTVQCGSQVSLSVARMPLAFPCRGAGAIYTALAWDAARLDADVAVGTALGAANAAALCQAAAASPRPAVGVAAAGPGCAPGSPTSPLAAELAPLLDGAGWSAPLEKARSLSPENPKTLT